MRIRVVILSILTTVVVVLGAFIAILLPPVREANSYDLDALPTDRLQDSDLAMVTTTALPPLAKEAILLAKDENYYSVYNNVFECIAKTMANGKVSTIAVYSATVLLSINKIDHFAYIVESEVLVCRMQMQDVHIKDKILDYYVKSEEFGRLIFGIYKASLFYFGKNIEELDIAQTAYLAGLAGSSRPPIGDRRDPDWARRKRDGIIDRLVAHGKITAAQAEAAKNERTPSK